MVNKEERLSHTIEPFVPKDPYVLISGTFPSPKSREVKFFYGHPQNRFWRVLAAVFDDRVPTTTEEKKAFLTRHHLALWDTVKSCRITGASDASIKEVIPNEIDELMEKYGIRYCFTTGQKAGSFYKKYIEPKNHIPCIVLPSTSAANCRMKEETLIEAYRKIREACEEVKTERGENE